VDVGRRLDVALDVFMVLFWAALIVFGVWAIRRFTDRSSGSARRILEERFARGEIHADEF
jgi:uncharacterized membrane protein